MRATLTSSTPQGRTETEKPGPWAFLEIPRPILLALAAFIAIAGIGLCVALIAGATLLFNILVFTLFTVLWIAFAAALVLSPQTLDNLWRWMGELNLIIQGVVWLLFLPLMIGLWIWERNWSLSVRLVLVIALGACNVYMFLPWA